MREDSELRRAAEIGAAREREACASVLDAVVRELEGNGRLHTPHEVAALIRARGPCLPLLPDEGELARLRSLEKGVMQEDGAAAFGFLSGWRREANVLKAFMVTPSI